MTEKPTDTAGSTAGAGSADAESAREPVVIKDKRKIDASGKPRANDGGQADTVKGSEPTMGQPGKTGSIPTDAGAAPAEVVPGEVIEQAVATVIGALVPILDDLDRAKEHGDLTGPFAAMAEQLAAALGKFGLVGFGEQGDPFDPTRHEAVAHQTSAEVTEPTCVGIMRRGYLLGERLLRPALVAVADPE